MINILLQAIAQTPDDQLGWLALADCLEEQGDPLRAELTRITRLPGGNQWRAVELMISRVRPCVPTFTNSIGMRLALIPAGKFRMGSSEDETGRGDDEGPQHDVEITRPFWMGVYPVTQEEYEMIMGVNPSQFKGVRSPVELVSWDDAVRFCWALGKREGKSYRLPTEAEWEFACRAGSTTPYYVGSDERAAHMAGWCSGSARGRTHPVGEKVPNAWGLHDMHGNVWEWCADWYRSYELWCAASDHRGGYHVIAQTNPSGPTYGSFRVTRGGSWVAKVSDCRSASRFWHDPMYRLDSLGFRVVCNHESQG